MQETRQAWRLAKKPRFPLRFEPRQAALALALVAVTVVADRMVIAYQARPVAPVAVATAAPTAKPATQVMASVAVASWATASEESLAIITEMERLGQKTALQQLQANGLALRLSPGQTVAKLGTAGYLGGRSQVRIPETGREVWIHTAAIEALAPSPTPVPSPGV